VAISNYVFSSILVRGRNCNVVQDIRLAFPRIFSIYFDRCILCSSNFVFDDLYFVDLVVVDLCLCWPRITVLFVFFFNGLSLSFCYFQYDAREYWLGRSSPKSPIL